MPLLFAGAIWYTFTAKGRYSAQRRAASAMNSLLLDNLQGVRQIKSYAREETELERFSKSALLVGETQLVIMRTWRGTPRPWRSSGCSAARSCSTWAGATWWPARWISARWSASSFTSACFTTRSRTYTRSTSSTQAGRAASDRVAEILDAAQENYGEAPSGPIVRAKGAVEYRHVSFSYRPDVPALNDINLAVQPGQCVALVGPTGAGKSTFVSLLSRFYEATGGEILLDGRNIADLSLRELREQIGVVSQETFLFNGTILDISASAGPRRRARRSRKWRARPACTTSSRNCPRVTTRTSASAA